MYINYNDYELLYLYHEGNAKAFDLLFLKYTHLIEVKVSEFIPYGDKKTDMIQEGRLVLLDCIQFYNEYLEVSFFSYFLICLTRRLTRLLGDDYYRKTVVLNENMLSNIPDNTSSYLYKMAESVIQKEFEEDIYIDIYNECVMGDQSLRLYATRHNIPYGTLYSKYRLLLTRLQKQFKKI